MTSTNLASAQLSARPIRWPSTITALHFILHKQRSFPKIVAQGYAGSLSGGGPSGGKPVTDSELIPILDKGGWTWVIQAGRGSIMSPSSLRVALARAKAQTAHGARVK